MNKQLDKQELDENDDDGDDDDDDDDDANDDDNRCIIVVSSSILSTVVFNAVLLREGERRLGKAARVWNKKRTR